MTLKLEYLGIFIFLFISLIIAFILFFLSYALSPKVHSFEKLTPYECGFEPFEDTRESFDVHFYLVGILFIIFDLEIAFLFPWSLNINNLGFLGFWSMIFFLLILTVGFIYEFKKGALDWS